MVEENTGNLTDVRHGMANEAEGGCCPSVRGCGSGAVHAISLGAVLSVLSPSSIDSI